MSLKIEEAWENIKEYLQGKVGNDEFVKDIEMIERNLFPAKRYPADAIVTVTTVVEKDGIELYRKSLQMNGEKETVESQ